MDAFQNLLNLLQAYTGCIPKPTLSNLLNVPKPTAPVNSVHWKHWSRAREITLVYSQTSQGVNIVVNKAEKLHLKYSSNQANDDISEDKSTWDFTEQETRTQTSSTGVDKDAAPLATVPTKMNNKRTVANEKPVKVSFIICSVCGYKATRPYILGNHMMKHTGEKPFHCRECSFRSSTAGVLERHIMTHTGEQPFQCTECPHKSSRASSLRQHMLTHTGEKPFHCRVCSFKFSQSSNLKQHVMTHVGENPFQCDVCPYKCRRLDILREHVLMHTGGQTFRCTECCFKSSRSRNLKQHMLNHAGKQPFQCQVCSFKSSWPGSLKTHMLRHAGQETSRCRNVVVSTEHQMV